MEKRYGIIFGQQIKVKHLNKIIRKWAAYVDSEPEEEDYVEIWLEKFDMDPHRNEPDLYSIIRIQKKFLPRFLEVMEGLPWHFKFCSFRHGHPSTEILGVRYEGLSFESLDGERYVFFNYEEDEKEIVWNRLKKSGKQWLVLDQSSSVEEAFANWIKELACADENR